MGDEVVWTELLRKLSSDIEEAEADPRSPEWMISGFRELEEQMQSLDFRIPVDLLHDAIGGLSDCRAMCTRLSNMAERLRDLSPPGSPGPPPQAPVVLQTETETETETEIEIETETAPFLEAAAQIEKTAPFSEEAAQIEKWLIPSSSDTDTFTFTEIVIAGEWGCGKTALAQKLFATPTIKEEFSPLIWVPLSGTMPEQEQEQEQEEEARVRVVKCIQENIGQDKWDELNGKRYLMVLDDVSWHWPGGLNLDLPKGSGGALILTTRRDKDFGAHHNHVITLEPQRKHWIRARDLNITWSDTSSYWTWTNLPPPEEMEEVAELLAVCWLNIIGSLELHKLLWNRSYSAYLVYKLKEERYSLDQKLWGGVAIAGKPGEGRDLYIDGDLSEATETESGWLEIKLGEFVNDFRADIGAAVEARLFQSGGWKSGLVVKGISFRLNC